MLVFEPGRIRISSEHFSIYESSPGIERGFCRSCGTTLSWKGRGLMSLHIGTLDDPDAYPPTLHWRYDERSPWYDEAATLPHVAMAYPE